MGLGRVLVTDEQLVAGFNGGDAGAFEALVERYKRDVYGLAYRVAGNHADAHDLSQEAFLRVYRGLKRFRGDSSFRTWLYRIVMNVSLNHLRKEGKRRAVSLDAVASLGHTTDPVSALDKEARKRWLGGAITKLPPKQRETLVLKVYKELRYTDIARVMSCSVGTAKANFHHAMANLRRAVAEKGTSSE